MLPDSKLSSLRDFSTSIHSAKTFVALVVLLISLWGLVPRSIAQGSDNNSMVQGIPPFSTQVTLGGGIDSIDVGTMNIHIAIPLNSNGAYGPKTSASLVLDSSLFTPWIQYDGIHWKRYYTQPLPFHLQTTGYLPYYYVQSSSGSGCNNRRDMTISGVVDESGAYHQTPTITTVHCHQTVASGPGPDGWQLVAVNENDDLYIWCIDPLGQYTEVKSTQLFWSYDHSIPAELSPFLPHTSTFDSHGNEVDNSVQILENDCLDHSDQCNMSASGALSDALGNIVLTSVIPGYSNYRTNSVELQYPGPGSNAQTYIFNYTWYTENGNGNCQGTSGIPPWWTQQKEPFLTSLVLPDGSSYHFTYELYWNHTDMYTGRIASVTLPTGGIITYAYSGGTPTSGLPSGGGLWCDDGSTATITRTTPDGTWKIAHSDKAGTNNLATTTITAPSGDYSIYTVSGTNGNQDVNTNGVYPVQKISWGVTGPSCSAINPCKLNTQTICYNTNTATCANPAVAPARPIIERDVQNLVPGITNPALSVYSYNSNSLLTDVKTYDFGGVRLGTNWDDDRQTSYGSWNGSVCSIVTGTINGSIANGTLITIPGKVCSKTLAVSGGTIPNYFTYNSYGQLLTQQHSIGGVLVTTATNTYDNLGRLTGSTGPNGENTTTAYTACSGQEPSSTSVKTSATTPSLTTYYTSWDCGGERVLVTQDPNGNNWSTNYIGDPFFRPTSTRDPLGNVTFYTYTPTTKDVKLTVNTGSQEETLTQVDSMGRPQLTEIGLNGTGKYSITNTFYDTNGRVGFITLPYTAPAGTIATLGTDGFRYTYDGLNRPLSETGPTYNGRFLPGTTKAYIYSANDTLITISPAPPGENTKATQTEVNGLGEVTSVCEIASGTGSSSCQQSSTAVGFKTSYTYYNGGRLSTITQNSTGIQTQLRSFTYDSYNTGRQLTSNTPESGMSTTTYDSDPSGYCPSFEGYPVKTVDNGGGTACMSYDLADRVIGVTYPTGLNSSATPPKTFVYDSTNNPAIVCSRPNWAGAIAEAFTGASANKLTDEGFCYDNDSRATDVFLRTSTGWANHRHITESYFADGQSNTLSVPTQPTITYTLDANARLYSATASSAPQTQLLTSVQYSSGGSPQIVTLGSGDQSTYSYYGNLEPLQVAHAIGTGTITHALTWNSNGTLAKLATTDQLNPANSQTCTFSYDDLERILTNNCGANWNESYSYDVFGNVTKTGAAPWPTVGSYTQSNNRYSSGVFSYDANGRLTNDTFDTLAWDVDGNLISQSGTSLVYDAFGRPVMAGATEYLYAPDGSLVATQNNSGTILKMFVPLLMARAVYSAGILDHYDRYDWEGSARVASTQVKTLYSDTSYDAFGIPYWSAGSQNNQYAGLNSDISSGMEQVSSTRRYHPTQGRWIAPDSVIPDIHNPQTFNAYHYALNQPTNTSDPGGNCEIDPTCTLDLGDWILTLPSDYPTFFNGEACSCQEFDSWFTTLDESGLHPQYPVVPTTLFPMPTLVIPANSGSPTLGIPSQPEEVFHPEWMSRSELRQLDRDNTAFDMTTKLGGAFVLGLGGPLSLWPETQVTEFTQVGPYIGRGGIVPVLQGQAGVAQSIAAASARGETVVGSEITMETLSGERARPDLLVRDANNSLKFIESKKGPSAALSANQKVVYPQLRQFGGVPRGLNAARAGLTPGTQIPPIPVQEDFWP